MNWERFFTPSVEAVTLSIRFKSSSSIVIAIVLILQNISRSQGALIFPNHERLTLLRRLAAPLLMQPGLVSRFLGVGRMFHAGNRPTAVWFAGQLEGDSSKFVTTDDMQRHWIPRLQQSDPLVKL